MKYRVYMEFVGSTSVVVEADDEAHAAEVAIDNAPQNDFGGAGWDAGDWQIGTRADGSDMVKEEL